MSEENWTAKPVNRNLLVVELGQEVQDKSSESFFDFEGWEKERYEKERFELYVITAVAEDCLQPLKVGQVISVETTMLNKLLTPESKPVYFIKENFIDLVFEKPE